jgi:hypothetical protein
MERIQEMAQAYTARARRSASKHVVPASLILAGIVPLPAQAADLQLVYLANFHNGSLDPSVDKLRIGALQKGDAEVPDSNPLVTPKEGVIELKVTKPSDASDLVSVGVFATGPNVHFDQGSKFEIRATFIKPTGPHNEGTVWAAALSARTGNNRDLAAEKRANVTLQSRGTGCRMNVLIVDTPARQDLEPAICDMIFGAHPQPFTLDLIVDRTSDLSTATLKVGSHVFEKKVSFTFFKKDSGPPITAVGPALAINTADHKTASVLVREFRILTPKPEH